MITIFNHFKKNISLGLQNPKKALRLFVPLMRGYCIKLKFIFLFHKRVKIGSKFKPFSKLIIKGPGQVIIGDNFGCCKSLFKIPTIITHTTDSIVIIGDDNYFGGAQISCVQKIKIGNDNLLGNTIITDSDIFPFPCLKIDKEWVKKYVSPIEIGNRCWFGNNTIILKDTQIADECVLAIGSVLNKNAEPLSLLMGNPARKIGITRESSKS